MSNKQTDAHWQVQQTMIEDFAEWLDRDFTIADTIYQQMKSDERVDPKTFRQIHTLYKEHVAQHTEECREEMITREAMHI